MKSASKWLGWLALLVLLAAGWSRLRLNVEVLDLLPGELATVRALKLYQAHFARRRELIVTLRAPDAGAVESAAQLLAEHLKRHPQWVARVTWRPPGAEDPGVAADLLAYLWLNQTPEAFRQLTRQLEATRLPTLLREAREQLATSLSPETLGRLSYDPFGFTQLPEAGRGGFPTLATPDEGFASPDGRFRILFVEARAALEDYRAAAAWLEQVQTAVQHCGAQAGWPGEVRVRYTGAPAFLAEIATGMERDLKSSAGFTLLVIAALFWWAHRSWRPLGLLLGVLALVVAGTLAAGGVIFGSLNVVSLGFAAILLGLAVDYGLVLYEESRAQPGLSAPALRGRLAKSILWSAVTTAGAFVLLNFGGLPGLAQLGSLISVGIVLAAVLMLYVFAPALVGKPQPGRRAGEKVLCGNSGSSNSSKSGLFTALILCGAVVVAGWKWPRLDHSTRPLQPRHSQAQEALDELQVELGQPTEPLWLLVCGPNESVMAKRLDAVNGRLVQESAGAQVESFRLPVALWPHPERQRENRRTATDLAREASRLRAAALDAGFTTNALALAEAVLRAWADTDRRTGLLWPTNGVNRWLWDRAFARTDGGWTAAGVVYPGKGQSPKSLVAALTAPEEGVCVTGWTVLGEVLLERVGHRAVWLVAGMVAVLVGCLWLAFGRWSEVLLSLATLGSSLLLLLAVMGLMGWSWNLMNLMALPLLLGAGVDYTIHVQLALRRHGGDARAMRRVTGRAVWLCAATTIAGFGSNAWSGNAGLASLGWVCATGVGAVCACSLGLLPGWWQRFAGDSELSSPETAVSCGPEPPEPAPSALYRLGWWRVALICARWLPRGVLEGLGIVAAEVYQRLRPRRCRVVLENLLPVFAGDQVAAGRSARRLFRQFALKVVDLWRYESGLPESRWQASRREWETLDSARALGKGVLAITCHLGNWELGGPLLAQHGVRLVVLTQPEPGAGFTDLRRAARARWGIETLVVGTDPFAFVEIIRRLEAGAVVAMLFDRPVGHGAEEIELFGRPFRASLAAAELARASGCALIGLTIVRTGVGHQVRMLREFSYDRRALGERAARRELTQEIARAFEPEIRAHPDQWFHFVPIWPAPPQGRG